MRLSSARFGLVIILLDVYKTNVKDRTALKTAAYNNNAEIRETFLLGGKLFALYVILE